MNPIVQYKIGTCSWKYDSWRGLIYPRTGEINYLEHYARHYQTVEIDQWFWSLHSPDSISMPKPDVVESYKKSVSEDFEFTIKIPNSISLTHFYRKKSGDELIPNPNFLSRELFEQFLEQVDPLVSKTFSFMLQFEYLNKQKIAGLDVFLEKLQDFIQNIEPSIPLGIECRNPNFMNERYFQFLKDKKVHPVFLQGYYMPDIVSLWENFSHHLNDRAVIRLHGPDRKGIEQQSKGVWNRILQKRDDELNKVSHMIRGMMSKGMQVTINVNNHYEGSAPLTIQRLNALLNPDLPDPEIQEELSLF